MLNVQRIHINHATKQHFATLFSSDPSSVHFKKREIIAIYDEHEAACQHHVGCPVDACRTMTCTRVVHHLERIIQREGFNL